MEEKTLKYLPFAGGLLVFLGVLKISIYYQYFGVSVLPYLSLSDVLLLFLSDLNTLLVLVVIGIVHIITSNEVTESLGTKVDFVILKFKWFYVSFFGITCAILGILLGLNKINIAIWNIYLIIFLAIQFLTFLFVKKSINEKTFEIEVDFRARKLLMLLITIVATSMMPLVAIKDIREVKTNGEKVLLHLTNNQELSSSNELYYLGKAGEYHFFFNSTKNKSKAIRNSDVISIEKLNQ